jgi:hypothetical protein
MILQMLFCKVPKETKKLINVEVELRNVIRALRFKSSKKNDLSRYAPITLLNSTFTLIHCLVFMKPKEGS